MKKTCVALSLLVLTLASPASACFSEEALQRLLAERAILDALHPARAIVIESLEVTGDRAEAVVSFEGVDHQRMAQTLWLARSEDGWHVTSQSYSAPVGPPSTERSKPSTLTSRRL